MPSNTLQFNGSDGCVYVFDLDKTCWKKICPVDKVPSDIRKQVYEYLEDAEVVFSNAEALKNAI